jgi:hypothetical protein
MGCYTTVFRHFAKAIPLLFSYTLVAVMWVEFVHALLEVPPEVLNRIEVR